MANRTASKNNATRTSPVAEQEVIDSDWVEATSTTLSTQPTELNVVAGVTITDVNSVDPVGTGTLNYKLLMEDATALVGVDPTNTGVSFTTGGLGKFGEAGEFTTTGDKLILPSTVDLVTASFWLNLNAISESGIISQNDPSAPYSGFCVTLTSAGKLKISTNGSTLVTGTTVLSTGIYYHILVELNGTTLNVYLNNSLEITGTVSVNTAQPYLLGSGPAFLNNFCNYKIDHFENFSSILTSQQRTDLYEQGSGTTTTSLVSSSTLTQGQEVTLVESDNSYTDGVLGEVTTDSIVNSTTPLGYTPIIKHLMEGATALVGTVVAQNVTNYTGTGQFGNGATFDGVDDKIEFSGINKYANVFTMSAWVNPTDRVNRFTICSDKTNTTVNFSINPTTGTLTLYANESSNSDASVTSTGTIPTGTLTHVACVCSSAGMKLYINGVEDGTAAHNGTAFSTKTSSSYIGAWGSLIAGRFAKGVIDQFEYIESALSQAEIIKLMNQYTGYSADITSFGLATAPTKAFLKDDTSISLAIESTPERIVNEVSTHLTVDATTDTTNLVVTEPIYEGEKLFIDDTEVTLGAVTESSVVSSTDTFGDGSLIAKYEFEDVADGQTFTTVADTIGTYNGTATSLLSGGGQFGQSGVFSGSSYVDTTSITAPSTMTVSLWFNATDISATQALIQVNNKYIVIYLGDVSSTTRGFAHQPIDFNFVSNTWYHLVVTQTTTTQAVYVDGIEYGLLASIGNSGGTAATNIRIGTDGTSGITTPFIGSIDQIEVYNRALTPTEVNTLYTQTGSYSVAHTLTATTPTKAYRKGSKALTVTGTPTTTEIIGTHATSGLLTTGDTILLDNNKPVVTTSVVEGTHDVSVPNNQFETVLYTGTGSTQTIPMANIDGGVDFVWTKSRTNVWGHQVWDSLRGATKVLNTSLTNSEDTIGNGVISLDADSFTAGGYEGTNNAANYVAWCASLPNHTVSNTAGTITSETKSNDFMSVVSYTGTGANATVGHGLSKAPELWIVKGRTTAYNWVVGSTQIANTERLLLDTTNAKVSVAGGSWNSTYPSDTVISLGGNLDVNTSTASQIAYAFTSVAGLCKVGSYTGTGAAGNAVTTGFEPAWVMIKRIDAANSWIIQDVNRGYDSNLLANTSAAENAIGSDAISTTSTAFSVDTTDAAWNASGGTYIYLAIAKDTSASIPKYTCTIPTQASAPTSVAVPDNTQKLTVTSKLFDGTKFNYTYGNYVKGGRAMSTKLESTTSGTTVLSPITTNLNKA